MVPTSSSRPWPAPCGQGGVEEDRVVAVRAVTDTAEWDAVLVGQHPPPSIRAWPGQWGFLPVPSPPDDVVVGAQILADDGIEDTDFDPFVTP